MASGVHLCASRENSAATLQPDVMSSTSSPGRFSLALGAGREKALASAGHMTTRHPAFVGVIN